MTNITLSIEDGVYKKMKKYSEIRWSDFVRKIIKKRIEEMERQKWESTQFLADEDLLATDWLSTEDNEAWKDL
mgnify:CR=1 FL=1